MSTHLDRKELKRPDTFLLKAQGIVEWVGQNSKTFFVAIAFVFLAALAIVLYNNFSAAREATASTEYYEIKKGLLDKVKKLDDATEAADKTKKEPKKSEPKIYDLFSVAKPETLQLESFITKRKGSTAAFYAATFLGDNLMSTKQVSKALEFYQKAAAMAPSQALKASAMHSLGYAYELTNDYDKAIDSLQKVLSTNEKQFKVDSLFALARNYESKLDKKNAIEQYNILIKDYPNTDTAKNAQTRKDLLN